jgi:predicted peptidase
MKLPLISFVMLFGQYAFCQCFEEQMNTAGAALQKKEYCEALGIFKAAFVDSGKIGTYEYAFAAVAAANCNAEKQALSWLRASQLKGLGQSVDEINAIAADSGFVTLHNYAEWTEIISDMRNALAVAQQKQANKNAAWVADIKANAIAEKQNAIFKKAKSGFALYYSVIGNLNVPYIVYVPKNYNPLKPIQAIVYLHGGIVNTENFNFENADIAIGEPIFSVSDKFSALIIYPFGKRDFGWVAQEKAFENVLSIIQQVQNRYNVNEKRIFLGGMSNGGTAAFWFASKKQNIFKGFYAFSGLPKLEVGPINFKNLGNGKPFYSVNAKDDRVFNYTEVVSIYNKNKKVAKKWYFDSLESGDHGFIYDPEKGKPIMYSLFKKLLVR